MRTLAQLDAHLDHVRAAPRDRGTIDLIVRRPALLAREIIEVAELDVVQGLVGDTWSARPSKRTADGSPHPGQQLTLMCTRAIDAICVREQWPLAGDQFYVDLDLSEPALPAGSQLALGSAVVEISDVPHTGCAKFTERFGSDATAWVNKGPGRDLRLRGVNARIVVGGTVKRGDAIRRLH